MTRHDTTRHDTSLSVYYDYQMLLAQRYGGISRYFHEIIPILRSLGVHADISCIHNRNYYFADELGLYEPSSNRYVRGLERRMSSFLNNLKTNIDIRMKHYDIIHPTYYFRSYSSGRSKLVIDVHDMIPERYSKDDWSWVAMKKELFHEADRIISVSEYTKKDMLEIYPDIEPEKVSVIYRGTSMLLQDEPKRKFSRMDGRDYVLFVGNRGWYKNFEQFFEAMKPILESHGDVNIFCAGGGAFTRDEQEMLRGYESRVFQGGLTDDELIDAYRNALCFVFPSLYEGFGIPILEAFACSCPLVCSRATSLPEVALDAAEYFDPSDTDSMTDAILRVLESELLREELRVRGRERLGFFSWEKSARETLACYESAIEER